MKRLLAFIAALFVLFALAISADPCEGIWKSYEMKDGKRVRVNAYWKIYTSPSGELRGVILKVWDSDNQKYISDSSLKFTAFKNDQANEYNKGPATVSSSSPIVGTIWMYGLKQNRTGFWVDGRIIHSGTGVVYACEVEYFEAGKKSSVDTLEFRGSIVWLPFFKEAQLWDKSSQSEADSAN